MLLDLLQNGFNPWSLITLIISLPVILFSLSVHETAHGLIAKKLGDPTAYSLGRLTLNPIKHIDPIGFLCMITVGFGWAKPVPVNARYFKNPRGDMAKVGIAGPISNLLLAVAAYILMAVTVLTTAYTTNYSLGAVDLFLYSGEDVSVLPTYILVLWALYTLLSLTVQLNLVLAVFNMIPVPPFDGSRFLYAFLPVNAYFKVMKYERYIGLGVILLIFLLSRVGIYPTSWIAGKIEDGMYFVIGKPLEALFKFIFNG